MIVKSTAAVLDPNNGVEIVTLDVRDPLEGEVRVRVDRAGVCHSDLHFVDRVWSTASPTVLGHEGSGIVESVGTGVTGIAVGDRVAVCWYMPCSACENCVAGRPYLCTGSSSIFNALPSRVSPYVGDDVPAPLFGVGTYSEYIILPQAAAIVVPSELPSDIACLIGCAVATGVGAVTNTADVRASDSAVVIGCGGVGLAIIMALSLVGATPIIAVDLAESRRELAVQAGATHALEGDDPELAAKVFGITGGADFAFDAIGLASTSASLPGLVRGGGAGVLVGMPRREAEVPFRTWELAAMNKRILGSNYGSTNARIDFPRIARMYLAGRLPLDLLVGAHRSIDDLDSAFADLKNSVGARTILDLGA